MTLKMMGNIDFVLVAVQYNIEKLIFLLLIGQAQLHQLGTMVYHVLKCI